MARQAIQAQHLLDHLKSEITECKPERMVAYTESQTVRQLVAAWSPSMVNFRGDILLDDRRAGWPELGKACAVDLIALAEAARLPLGAARSTFAAAKEHYLIAPDGTVFDDVIDHVRIMVKMQLLDSFND